MIKFLFTTLLTITAFIVNAQTFTITEVNTLNKNDYQKYNKRYLNKEMKVKFNDKSVTLFPASNTNNESITLQKDRDNYYSFSKTTGSTYENWSVEFIKTVGVITSLKFVMSKRDSNSSTNDNNLTLIGKRF